MTTPAPASRPRTVEVAFWCWLAAAVVAAAQGLWVVNQGVSQRVPWPYLAMAGILIVAGLGMGYLAGRARKGQKRLADAAIGLAMALVVICVLMLLMGGGGLVTLTVIMILVITGSVMSQRPTSQQWYESQGTA